MGEEIGDLFRRYFLGVPGVLAGGVRGEEIESFFFVAHTEKDFGSSGGVGNKALGVDGFIVLRWSRVRSSNSFQA